MRGDQPKGHSKAIKGLIMVDIVVAMVLIKKWADAHGLTIKEKVAEYISGAHGTTV